METTDTKLTLLLQAACLESPHEIIKDKERFDLSVSPSVLCGFL